MAATYNLGSRTNGLCGLEANDDTEKNEMVCLGSQPNANYKQLQSLQYFQQGLSIFREASTDSL